MSTNAIPFAFDSTLVRAIVDEAGEPWFVAKDIALALGYASTNMGDRFSGSPGRMEG